jgi:3-hydroxybutyrate dehydrogenase
MNALEGRVALVSGAASGIGRAIASRLCSEGMSVLAVDIEPATDGPGLFHQADLGRPEQNQAAVDRALSVFGRLDAVIPNAGFQHVAPIAEFDQTKWDSMLALLLTSPFLLAKHAWPALCESPQGRFVAIASVHGLVASPYKAAYVSAKHGVLGLVKTLALEGASAGVSACAVCPAFVRTPLVEAQIEDQAKAHGMDKDRVLEDVVLASHPVKRLIEPEEVADVVAFLLGPGGSSFTGTPVTMDLGWSAR